MKKSVVATRAWVSLRRQTAASSEVSVPTMRLEKAAVAGMPFRIDCRTAGASLQPQPPPWAREVRRGLASGAIAVIGSILSRLRAQPEGQSPVRHRDPEDRRHGEPRP